MPITPQDVIDAAKNQIGDSVRVSLSTPIIRGVWCVVNMNFRLF